MNARNHRRRRQLLGAAALGLCLGAACTGGGRDLERPPGSVLWLSQDGGVLDEAGLEALTAAGVEEVFVEAATLAWAGDRPVLDASWDGPGPPRRAPATLVVTGRGPADDTDAGEAAEGLASALRRLHLDAQGRGMIPRGFHLDLAAAGELPPLTHLIEELGRRIDPSSLLSVTLDRRWLDDSGVERLAEAADFLVVFLYGRREAGVEDTDLWDLAAVERGLTRLEELGGDYLLGVSTLGWAARADGRGGLGESTTAAGLRALVRTQGLESRFGFTLDGPDRRLYTFEARSPVAVLGWRLAPGEAVQASRLTGSHLRHLRERLDALPLEHHLGEAWFRPPRPEELLSLTPAGLADALARTAEAGGPPPVLEVRLAPGGRRGGGIVLRVQVRNPNPEATEIARVETNYVELWARRGSFEAAETGGFERYDLLDGATGRRTLRRPDTLRLYTPFVDAGEALTSGPVFLAGGRSLEDLEVSGTFLMPDGAAKVVRVGESRPR